MDYIFVDTGVFEENNFLDSKAIKQLLKLADDGEITIVLPKITYNEIIARAKVHIRAGIDLFNGAKKTMRVMRNIPARMPLFDKTRPDDVIAEFIKIFEEQLKRVNYLELDYPTVDVTEIFSNYFEGKFPFGKGDKKHEFPDAFALITVEQWCKQQKHQCYVFSTDNDLLKYASPYLKIVPDYKAFLNEMEQDFAETKGSISAAVKYITDHKLQIELPVVNWLEENLDDESRYTDVVNYLPIQSIIVKETQATIGNPESINIHGDTVEVEMLADIHFVVDVEIPDESTGWFDDEEREWHYFDITMVRIDRVMSIPVMVGVNVSVENGVAQAHSVHVGDINSGDDIQIKEEKWHHYK
jgi:PIN domain